MYRQTYVIILCTNYKPSFKSELVYWLYTAKIERLFNPAKDISAVSITEFGKPEC